MSGILLAVVAVLLFVVAVGHRHQAAVASTTEWSHPDHNFETMVVLMRIAHRQGRCGLYRIFACPENARSAWRRMRYYQAELAKLGYKAEIGSFVDGRTNGQFKVWELIVDLPA